MSSLFPSPQLGISLVVAATLLMLAFALLHRKTAPIPSKVQTGMRWLIPGLAFAGTYIFFLRWVDEVFINLEHPWNLYHFGRYSFSPAQMVDGTVEVAYYFLLTPFAASHEALVIANIVLAGLLSLAHLFFVFRILSGSSNAFQILAGVCFAVWWPLVCILANGFGTGVISLAFLAAIASFLRGTGNGHLLLAALLPLIRIDGIAYSATIFFADLVEYRRTRWRHWFGAAASLGCVLAFFRVSYGHWIPTPVSFKSFSPNMTGLIQRSDIARFVEYFENPLHVVAAISGIFAVFLWRTPSIRRLLLLLPPLGALFVFYTLVSWNPVYDGRYYFGWELVLMLLPLIVWKKRDEARNSGLVPLFPWLSVSLLTLSAAGLYLDGPSHRYTATARGGWRPYYTQRVDGLAAGGQVMDALIPLDWTISATELNSFGFMHDRPVVDLWGYTNPQIAKSRLLSDYRIRNSPEVFLETSPDIHWHRTGRKGTQENGSADYEKFERAFFAGPNIARFYDQLGDMNRVVRSYDFMLLKTGNWWTTLLVRKDRTDLLVSRLHESQYRLSSSRHLDWHAFKKAYGAN